MFRIDSVNFKGEEKRLVDDELTFCMYFFELRSARQFRFFKSLFE